MSLEQTFIATASAQGTPTQGSDAATPKGAQGGIFGMFLPMILIFGIFYLLLIRPQAKQRKQHAALVSGLKKGDEVITSAGIHGRISGVADAVATVEIAENVRIKVEKSQITTVKKPPAVTS